MCSFLSSSDRDFELLARFLDLQKDFFKMDNKLKELQAHVDFLESTVRHFVNILNLATPEEIEAQQSFVYKNICQLTDDFNKFLESDKKN